jgi:signal transduction histidine kinase
VRGRRALVPALLAVLLAALATMQYHWTGALGRAEEERARSSLNRAAAGLAADFDRELGRLFFHFLAPPSQAPETQLAGALTRWRAQPGSPELLRQLLLAERAPEGGVTLAACDETTGAWLPTSWPAELLPLRPQIESGRRIPWGVAAAEVPALVVPVLPDGDHDRGERERERRRATPSTSEGPAADEPTAQLRPRSPFWSGRSGGEEPRAFAVLWLDTGALAEHVFPVLVDRHLGSDVAYRVEVRDAAGRRLYAEGPQPVAGEPDVTMPLFRVPLVERFARHHAEHHGRPRAARPDREQQARVPGALAFDDETRLRGRWLLSITHPAGSLQAAVSRARWRNLALSFAVLGLLAAAVGLALAAARREQALARRQIELVAGVSHELLTPVAALRSAGENLAAGVVTEPAKVREYGELIVREGRRLGGLVEQVLTWAGLQARGKPATRQPVDAGSLVEAVAAACADEAAAAGVAVETTVAPALPVLAGDRDALERALRNLVENAIRHGRSGGWLSVRAELARRDDGAVAVALVVEDRGPGVAAADLPHLFEPFYRGGSTVPGSGLGLALARQIAEAHGGAVRVAGVEPHGARFTLELPASDTRRAAEEAAVAAAKHGDELPEVSG